MVLRAHGKDAILSQRDAPGCEGEGRGRLGMCRGCKPILGLVGSPAPGVRSSLCHFVTFLPLQRHLASSWTAALLSRPLLSQVLPPLSGGHTRHHIPVLPVGKPTGIAQGNSQGKTHLAASLFQKGGRFAFRGALKQM